jgi:hypothetical protein
MGEDNGSANFFGVNGMIKADGIAWVDGWNAETD